MSNIPNEKDSSLIHDSFQRSCNISFIPQINSNISSNLKNEDDSSDIFEQECHINSKNKLTHDNTPSQKKKPRLTSYNHPNFAIIERETTPNDYFCERKNNSIHSYTTLESNAILSGVKQYGKDGQGKFQWVKILNDSKYSEILKDRTASGIRDRYRTLKKNELKKKDAN